MFNQAPTKLRDDYAKFELEDPPINLALMQVDGEGAKGHFGVQVKSTKVIQKAIDGYTRAGFAMFDEDDVSCCYADQTKTWVVDPDGNKWEIYVVTNDETAVSCPADCICYRELAPSVEPAK
jgi:hypothetical protein